ncbi:hypothetical protein ACQPZF_31825 [Actinosynnema sp. CS-041913]|uniref:hypothetical protein n=1 Tax=Actinosynnema sp. CS-041913 TaxID=3239917 RepID=UPI003D91648E
MEIRALRVGVVGPHGPLLKPTSLRVPPGELVLVAGPPGAGHTALGLVLSGRLRPSTGTVTPNPVLLRKHVVVVDAPDVNEPEASWSLAVVVGEELAMNGRRVGRKAVADWLVDRGAGEHIDTRFEYVPADVRCRLMLELAAGRPDVRALVLDTPDRYHGDPKGWWQLARKRVRPDLSVVVLCTETSAAVLGVPAARLGEDNTAVGDTAVGDGDDTAVEHAVVWPTEPIATEPATEPAGTRSMVDSSGSTAVWSAADSTGRVKSAESTVVLPADSENSEETS